MTEYLLFLLSSFVIYLSYYIIGLFIYKKFYSKIGIINFHETTLIGLLVLSLLSVAINFFLPLTKYVNILILSSSLILSTFLEKKDLLKIIKYTFCFVAALSIFSIYARNPEDATLYHLSFISILNEEKINFGLSNFHHRFGHISIVQYLSALSFIPWISKYLIITQNNFIFCLIVIILLKKLYFNLKKNNGYAACFIFFSLLFICLKLAKFSDWGNDLLPALLTFYVTIFLIDILQKKYDEFNFEYIYLYLLLILTFIFLSKVSYIYVYGLLFFLFFKEKNLIKFFNIKILLIMFLIFIIYFSRNFISTSCLIYPLTITCIDTLWHAGNSEVNRVFIEAKSWSMGISDLKNINIDQENFVKKFYWIKVWMSNHFFKVMEKIFSFLFFGIFIFLISKYLFKLKMHNINLPKFHNYLIFAFFIFVLLWFTSSPLFRYGTGLIISFIIILIIPIFHKYFYKIQDYRKFHKFTLIVVILTISLKNIVRLNNDAENTLLPKTFIDKNLGEININEKKMYFSDGKECYYPKNSPCLKYEPLQIENISNFGSFKIYIHN